MCSSEEGGRVHRAEIGESFFVEVGGALLEIKVEPSKSGRGKDIALLVTNLSPELGFSYKVAGEGGGARSTGACAPQVVIDGPSAHVVPVEDP
jgi:hypothetical protein